jgi:multimeric flavodoxin WrbA
MTTQKPDFSNLKALYINCTLKASPRKSHTQALMEVSMNIMKSEGVIVEELRFVDYNIAFGVYHDMTEHGVACDDWPKIWKKVEEADILVIGTPIWLGEKSSVATQLIERLYAESGKRNRKGNIIFMEK